MSKTVKELWTLGGWANPQPYKHGYKVWFAAILVIFWVTKSLFAYHHGNQPYLHTDSSTEGMTIFAAKHYLHHGFFENDLLPTYPPFGHDPEGKVRTEPFVYSHYLAGQDLVAALFMKTFGENALWAVRLIPHTMTVIALAWLTLEFAAWMGSALMGCLFLSLMMLPRSLVEWSICLYGHSYVMAFFLALVAGLLRFTRLSVTKRDKKPYFQHAWVLGFVIGLLQMFFDLDWVPLTFLWTISFVILMPTLHKELGKRVVIGMLLGGSTAMLYQVVISSLHYGSFTWVIDNLVQWARYRAGTHVVENITEKFTMDDLRLHRVLQEYNRQTLGATAFTAHQLMALSAVFLILAKLTRAIGKIELKRGIAAIFMAYFASAFWNIVMREHSVIHIHFLPRLYFPLFMTFALISLPMCYRIVLKSKS